MDDPKNIAASVAAIESQIRELECLIEKVLVENKPEDAALVAAMMDDIKRRNVFH